MTILGICATLLRTVITDQSKLIDMNADGRPDRILLKPVDSANPLGRQAWYIQWNNGKGFDPALRKKKSFGLVGIRERASMLDGDADIISVPDIGTTIKVSIPVSG